MKRRIKRNRKLPNRQFDYPPVIGPPNYLWKIILRRFAV